MNPIKVTVRVRSNVVSAEEDQKRLRVTLNASNNYMNTFDGALVHIQDSEYCWVVQEASPFFLVRAKINEIEVKEYPIQP